MKALEETEVQPKAATATAACPLCANPTPRALYDVQTDACYTILRCDACSFAFAAPRPTPAQLAEFYSSTYFKRQNVIPFGYAEYRGVAEANARHMWGFLSKTYLTGAAETGCRILDVGCATGAFLAEAQRAGWTATGVELSADMVDVARKEFGVNVLHADLSSESLAPNSFDVITMWHVLEHLIDPVAAIARANELLVAGGKLYIELPNWNSLGRMAKGTSWSQLRPPEHINFFTPRSLASLIGRSGFRIFSCGTAYPSLRDKARVRRASQPIHLLVGAAAVAAERLGWGGYIRLFAGKL